MEPLVLPTLCPSPGNLQGVLNVAAEFSWVACRGVGLTWVGVVLLSFMRGPIELSGGDERFVLQRDRFTPAYLRTFEEGGFKEKAKEAIEALGSCRVCPRTCGVDRLANRAGVCRIGRYAHVANAFPHFGEEDCLRGWRGSGTIFFAGCNLRCVFCQNYDISQQCAGREMHPEELAALMLDLQAAGCHNINFVTPEHVVPQVLKALIPAIDQGLRLPLVYNTSSYDSLESIRLMEGVVDIYMPDFKLWDVRRSRKYLGAGDYPQAAIAAIKEMHRQVGQLCVDEKGLALRGLLVRHLVMPGLLDDTREILRWLASELSRDTYVNVMDQYFPAWKVTSGPRYSEINQTLARSEFREALQCALEADLWRLDGASRTELECLRGH